MDIDLNKLEELAKAATPGPWRIAAASGELLAKIDTGYASLLCCDYCHGSVRGNLASMDVEYIAAANPAVVLELIGRLRVAECLLDARLSSVTVRQPGDLIVLSVAHDYPDSKSDMMSLIDGLRAVFPYDVSLAVVRDPNDIKGLSDADLRRIGLVKATPADKKREAFEAWARQQDYFCLPPGSDIDILEIDQLGAYRDVPVHAAWLAWQAAR